VVVSNGYRSGAGETRRWFPLLAGLALATGLLWAQTYTAAIRGTVTDATGASVPRATVTVTEVDRNVAHKTITDEAGRYVVTALPPGNYTLTVEATGFRKYVRSPFPLTVQQQATVDVQLEVGEVTATVEVASRSAAAEHDHRQPRAGDRKQVHHLPAQHRPNTDGLDII
jgi:hypothetical protein